MEDLVVLLEQRKRANYKPEYNFVVRKHDIGKGYSVSVLWRGARSIRSMDLIPTMPG